MNYELTVTRVEQHGDACISVEMDAPFQWEAGQFVRVTQPGTDDERCYSISRTTAPLRIAVKRVHGGQVSNWLNDHVRPGSRLSISAPSGSFTLRPGVAPIVLIAGGSGITPILSLAQAGLSSGRPVTLFYASRSKADEIYREDIDALMQDPKFSVERHYDAERGYPTVEQLSAYAQGEADFYLCGPAPLIALGEQAFEGKSRVFIERFSSSGDAAALPEPTAAPDSFSLWLDGRCRTVPYVAGQTLLECAQAAGLKPRSSCESGFCGSCMARVRDGDVLMRSAEALTDSDRGQGLALLCQSVPANGGALELDADNTSFRLSQRKGFAPQTARLTFAAAVIFMVIGTAILRLT